VRKSIDKGIEMPPHHTPLTNLLLIVCLLLPVLSACNQEQAPIKIEEGSLPEVTVSFRVVLPAPLNPGETVLLSVLDEVTGLALNTKKYAMSADSDLAYSVLLSFPVGSVVKYRYTRQSEVTVQEHFTDGRPVRYRMAYISASGVVDDIISRWTDTLSSVQTGRLIGEVLDQASGYPIGGILIAAGGAQTLTAADGTFRIEGMPVGKHNVVAYAVDGTYHTFQQEAVIATESATPAPIRMAPATLIPLSFVVQLPDGTPPEAIVRLAGNLQQTGNSFANLNGGLSTVAARMPVLNRLPDGRYNVVLNLPAGTDFRYKYTLGDGLWSAEMSSDGGPRIRQLVVPDRSAVVEDSVSTWNASTKQPVVFEVNAPTTPSGQNVSIQFNPGFSWMEPIPMWSVGTNTWRFILTGPLNMLQEVGYRYCREDQCGKADDTRTMGVDSPPLTIVQFSDQPSQQADLVETWAWFTPQEPPIVPNLAINPRGRGFVAGVEFSPSYDPTWYTRWSGAIQSVRNMQANWLVLTPTWSYTRPDQPILEPQAGSDIPWSELRQLAQSANSAGINTAIYPLPHFNSEPLIWWQNAQRDFSWWVTWFDQYRTFLLHHADLADQTNAEALIIGGEWVMPALPGGRLEDGTESGVPNDAEIRWRDLLAEVRTHFDGQLVWALPYSQVYQSPPAFLEMVDIVEIMWMASLTTSDSASLQELQAEAARLLDANAKPIADVVEKPIWLGISYPSANGGATGCVSGSMGGCLSMDALARLNEDIPEVSLDLQEQADAYQAMLTAVEARPWINGVITRGYYPPLPLQDKSSSVYGKPAMGILWFWFSSWLKE